MMAASTSTTCKSKVWKFFHKVEIKLFVTCHVVQANLAYHGGTSSMKEHLKQKHPADNPLKESERPGEALCFYKEPHLFT